MCEDKAEVGEVSLVLDLLIMQCLFYIHVTMLSNRYLILKSVG